MNTTRSEAQWPYDERSDQVHAEQLRDRERVQQDIQEAWDRIVNEARHGFHQFQNLPECKNLFDADIKLLKWALGTK